MPAVPIGRSPPFASSTCLPASADCGWGSRLSAAAASSPANGNRFAQKTYLRNFADGDDHVMAGDIRPYGAASSKIPAFDVLLAGFPCQPFSLAGVSKKNSLGRLHGFEDEKQGNLFFEIERILRHHRPAAFLLENDGEALLEREARDDLIRFAPKRSLRRQAHQLKADLSIRSRSGIRRSSTLPVQRS